MPKPIRQYDLSLTAKTRHVVFMGTDALAYTTSTGAVWRVAAGPAPSRSEVLFTGRLVLSPVAQALGRPLVAPAGGGYPRLAVSLPAKAVVVNTHDLVLVACFLDSDDRPLWISDCWGEYYPRLSFSSDGSRFAAKADTLWVFDTHSWGGRSLDSVETCGWHPRQPVHLCADHDGGVFWADWSRGAPAISPLGTIGVRDGWNQSRGLTVLEDGERFVVAFHPPRLELWHLNPLRLIESLNTDDGEIFDCRLSPNGRWLVVLSERGARLWDTKTPFGLSVLFPEILDLEFGPSGQRFLTQHWPVGGNPYPEDRTSDGAPGGRLVSLWDISE